MSTPTGPEPVHADLTGDVDPTGATDLPTYLVTWEDEHRETAAVAVEELVTVQEVGSLTHIADLRGPAVIVPTSRLVSIIREDVLDCDCDCDCDDDDEGDGGGGPGVGPDDPDDDTTGPEGATPDPEPLLAVVIDLDALRDARCPDHPGELVDGPLAPTAA